MCAHVVVARKINCKKKKKKNFKLWAVVILQKWRLQLWLGRAKGATMYISGGYVAVPAVVCRWSDSAVLSMVFMPWLMEYVCIFFHFFSSLSHQKKKVSAMTAQFSFSDVRYSALHSVPRNKQCRTILFALCFFLALSLLSLLSTSYSHSDHTKTTKNNCEITNKELDEKRRAVGQNWIVVTTINQPTDAMDLLCNLQGWNVSTRGRSQLCCGHGLFCFSAKHLHA